MIKMMIKNMIKMIMTMFMFIACLMIKKMIQMKMTMILMRMTLIDLALVPPFCQVTVCEEKISFSFFSYFLFKKSTFNNVKKKIEHSAK